MSIKIIWRSGVFLVTLVLIYFAFPILIVPSSLPAIQQMVVENELPEEFLPEAPYLVASDSPTDLEIYELNIPTIPTLKDKIEVLKTIHQQGMDKIFNPVIN